MPELHITVAEKIAIAQAGYMVCENSDYTISFSFDEEWNGYTAKTARFAYENSSGKTVIDVPFAGSSCSVPILSNTTYVEVGVYAGEIHTTTPCVIPCMRSILCRSGGDVIADPTPDVYEQIASMIGSFVSITNIQRTSGDGTAGSTDVYTITYSNGSTATFTIYNAEESTDYIHIKYSSKEPTADSDMKDEPDIYLGVYVGRSDIPPMTYTSYTWWKLATYDIATEAEIDAICSWE